MSTNCKLTISVVLDTVCPWCYVGARRLSKALVLAKQKWPEFEATVEYVPFQLDKSMGKGLNKAAVYEKKFGSRMAEMNERLAEAGKEEGIAFKFGGKMSNTLDSHRLIDYAKLSGSSDAEEKVVKSLFRRYFEQEEDIGDHDVLLGAAEDAGLDRQQAKAYLESSDGVEALQERMRQVKKLGVTGVPFYIINNRFGVSGAETPETFVSAFKQVFECTECH
ncbi:hypothetical protein LPJ77_001678 [Coemansia sp. RSA 2523]|nr:hypothetical protein LPJ54_001188 [Coemansia sp. RSA 1824]KAJ1791402.1 hypothetical protein LPJ62_001416 [Coemansia sp. RSA 2167]KAJ1809390.1 hypothetical protein LPJ77_001678 [Coemansia sp. RSA 2523]KAJ2250796.1 hypothetical protein GGH97_000452 [Coemansia sp. RSA 475]KAJ2257529.1 hypothetical protein GGH98_000794 [Coemansia sp. RSA 454]KAJ2410100.1 hypothetical protein J3F80_000839 [Coemansia sp. RSA 2526]KAJ2429564.1 hypothetical protein GGF47_000635 [Coemansia sp. RSA 2524]KAJ2555917.